ncbi:MAG: hypothetical protein HY820_29965 [Acidobacteria bacterium]|nr:hypothetical protein [Acidobacteriota bacterium]
MSLGLRELFPPHSPRVWDEAIVKDLKGADYEKRLVWRTAEGLAIRPYYTRDNLSSLPWLDAAPGQAPFVRGDGRPWEMVSPEHEPAAQVDAAVWHEQGATTVQELAFALARGVEVLAGAAEPVDLAAPKMVFRFAAGSNFFFEIAKLRAARLLWAQVVKAFGAAEEESSYLHIHVRTSLLNKTLLDPYNNVLRATAEALAAVLGGCDWLTVMPFAFEQRLAETIQYILREECHFDRVADAGGGSYYLESLTASLAGEAWKLFQQVEAAGGLSAYPVAEALRASYASQRRRVLVGTNQYPAPAIPNAWAEAGERLAGPIEALRQRTAKHVERTGREIRVLLLESGDLKMRRARSGFCTGFFGCAGFRTSASTELAEADLIVLCSSDAEYTEFAARICPKTKTPVLVAGNPREHIASLEAAGVSGFVHLGSDVVSVLSDWQMRLGMEK